MRLNSKTVKDLAQKFKDGQTGSASSAFTTSDRYLLHGNCIARIEGNKLIGNWCGWATPTTQRHLTNIAEAFSCDTASFGGLSRKRGDELGGEDFIMKEPAR